MAVDPDVVRRQIENQMKLAVRHLKTEDAEKIVEYVKGHIIYPSGDSINKPMADLYRFGESFLKEAAVKAIEIASGKRSDDVRIPWTDKNRWE